MTALCYVLFCEIIFGALIPDYMYKLLFVSCLLIAILACAGKEKTPDTAQAVDGASVYKKYCVLCHGSDGKLGVSGSKDITASKLTKAERMELIRNGKNTMTPFGGVLSDAEIEAVAEYTFTIK